MVGISNNRHHRVCTYESNALANPWAVVIKLLDAVVADGAVRGSWRAVPEAGLAKLELHCEAIHDDILGPAKPHPRGAPDAPLHRWRGGEVPFISFRRRGSCVSWHYSWVSGRCHEQEEQVLQYFGEQHKGCSVLHLVCILATRIVSLKRTPCGQVWRLESLLTPSIMIIVGMIW